MKDTASDLAGSPTESFKGLWESGNVSILFGCLASYLSFFPLNRYFHNPMWVVYTPAITAGI